MEIPVHNVPKETHEEKMNGLKEAKLEEKLNALKRDNDPYYKMRSTIGDHATRGFMEFCAKTASESILEIVKRELDIRYDNNPTISTQLGEIASGITIIHNAVTLAEDQGKKETSLITYMTKDSTEQKKEQKKIENELVSTYKSLRHLRNEHIDQLNAIRKKRNPNFVPYAEQK